MPPKHRTEIPEVDVRKATAPGATAQQRIQGVANLKERLPNAQVSFDARLGAPKFVHVQDGFLTGPDGEGRGVSKQAARGAYQADPDRAVKLFLDQHSNLFGHGAGVLASSRKVRETVGAKNGLRTVVWQQEFEGLPVFESKLVGNITKNGELVSVSSRLLPDPGSAAAKRKAAGKARAATPEVSASEAIAAALSAMDEPLDSGESISAGKPAGDETFQSFKIRNKNAHSRLVWLPMDRDTLRLAWEIYVFSRRTGERFQVLVDANTGETLVRQCVSHYISDATYNVYTSDSPSPFSPGWPAPNAGQPGLVNRILVTTNAFSVLASPNGWIDDGQNETRGNNTDTFVDRDFDGEPDGGTRTQGNPERVFDFPLDLTQDPLEYTNAAVVNMFYHVNVYHDLLYELGFTESAGNFQRQNFGRGGAGNDEIISHAQAAADLGARNNAFFSVAPDGINGEIAMFLWDFPNPERDGDLDAEIIIHEATHGTSWRLVGGGMGLGNLQGDGMGEGWSDFYSLSMLSEPGDDPDAAYAMGGYVTYQFVGLDENYYFGIRNFPMSTDMTKNPFTFKDIDPTQIDPHVGVPRSPIFPFDPESASEVHHQGEVWCAALWEVRANLIHKHGFDGNALMLQLVTDGMKLTPAEPTYMEARDAILLADQINTGGANMDEIWRGFAKRGMGVSARSPDSDTTTGVVEAYDLPGLALLSVSVEGGNGNGMIDFDECNTLSLVLTNRGEALTNVTVNLSSPTPGVFVLQSQVVIPIIPAGGVVSNSLNFQVSTIPEFICGTTVVFALDVKSDQENRLIPFSLETGTVGVPTRFDSVLPVSIPENNPVGVTSPIQVSGITGAIGDVEVSLFLQHTFDADLTLQLISPDGVTNLLASRVGGSGDNFGQSCASDATRTVFSDNAVIPIASGTPPFVGVFKPQAPLSTFRGKTGEAVNGEWKLRVVDDVAIDVGVLQCWSLILYPVECQDGGGQCPGVDLALAMTDQPDPVVIGSNLVYTITVTNRGPNTAPATIVTHNLPSSVLFLSATTTMGSVSHSGGVVLANLGSMPLGSTATVTVTVRPLTTGNIVSSANVVSLEPELNPPNNIASVVTSVQNPSADLSVVLSAAPNPTTVGGPLTYTATVRNHGPSVASGVVITNTLSPSVLITGASSSQGSTVISGNTVICVVGSLANGATATATINAVPLTSGTILATSRVVGNLADPILANNVSTVATTVGEAADLAITIVDSPDPVIVNSNFTYLVTITNRGPNAATQVVVNQSLPASLNVVSSSVSQGSVLVGGGVAVWTVGTFPAGSVATLTIVGNSASTGVLNTSATVNGAQADPNTANNTAVGSTLVATPFVSIVSAGSALISESVVPANGAIDIGETVSIDFRLRNAGNVPNANNLTVSLLAGGGVTSPSGPVNYGILAPSGPSASGVFSFTATGTNGGAVNATLQVVQGEVILTNIVLTFGLPTQHDFTNSTAIVIPDSGPATPYPSSLLVSGVSGRVGQVTVTLNNMSHTFAADVDLLLVSPTGQKVVLMGSAGDPFPVANATITLSDAAAQALPQGSAITTGSYRPANYNPAPSFPAPAPAGSFATQLSAFADSDPNGTWSLFVVDHSAGDDGSIASGWNLGIKVIDVVNEIADIAVVSTVNPAPALVGGTQTWNVIVTNLGPAAAHGVIITNTGSANLQITGATVSQGVVSSQSASQVISSLGDLEANGSAVVTITASPVGAGLATYTSAARALETDLNLANNTDVVSLANVLPKADLAIGLVAPDAPVVVGSNFTATVTVTNLGPEDAINTIVTLPAVSGLQYDSAILSQGTSLISAGNLICSFGKLTAGATAVANVSVQAVAAGSTNLVATVSTESSDTNAANNTASATITSRNPMIILAAAGAAVVAESQSPANGAIESGETVSVSLLLANNGELPTANLQAVLLAGDGVQPVAAVQNYGSIAPGGSEARTFAFQATGAPGADITATLQLTDNSSPLGTVAFVFTLSSEVSFTNATAIVIPNNGAASPYPSVINVSGLTGAVANVRVTLNQFSHSFPADIDAVLVGPQGQSVLLMSDAGGGWSVTNVNLLFNDSAATGLPGSAQLFSGTFLPTDFVPGDVLPAPAPVGPWGDTLAVFDGVAPNGAWSLYVADDSNGDAGTIGGGWALGFSVVRPVSAAVEQGPFSLSAEFDSGASAFRITLTGQAGVVYILQRSTNLADWTNTETNAAAANGILKFGEINPAGTPGGFYRAVRQMP